MCRSLKVSTILPWKWLRMRLWSHSLCTPPPPQASVHILHICHYSPKTQTNVTQFLLVPWKLTKMFSVNFSPQKETKRPKNKYILWIDVLLKRKSTAAWWSEEKKKNIIKSGYIQRRQRGAEENIQKILYRENLAFSLCFSFHGEGITNEFVRGDILFTLLSRVKTTV